MSKVQIEIQRPGIGPAEVVMTDMQIINNSLVFTVGRVVKTAAIQGQFSVPKSITVNIDDIMALVKQP